jgi:hypothetical protein
MSGVHLSLGSKHAVYAKPGLSKRRTKYHVDVFAAVDRLEIDGVNVWAEGFFDPAGRPSLDPAPRPA